MVENNGKIVPITRLCFLESGDQVTYNGLELWVVSVNGVVIFRRENGNLYEQRPSGNSQEWVEIIKKQTNEKNINQSVSVDQPGV